MDILCMKTMDVTGVTGNVLSLEFMSRATDPCGALLDLEIVGDWFSCVHYWLNCDKIVFVKKFYYLLEGVFVNTENDENKTTCHCMKYEIYF